MPKERVFGHELMPTSVKILNSSTDLKKQYQDLYRLLLYLNLLHASKGKGKAHSLVVVVGGCGGSGVGGGEEQGDKKRRWE